MMSRQCTVIRRSVTIDDIRQVRESQKNIVTTNERDSDESALKVALRGSKVYLQAHNFLDQTEE